MTAARELDARSDSQIGRSLFRPTVGDRTDARNARLRAIASDDGTGHSLDTIELGRVLKRRTRSSAARSTCSGWTPA